MFAANLTTDSFSEAVNKTFDGEHPCGLCCAVNAGKATEKKTDLPAPLKKFEYVNDAPRFVFAAPTAFTLLSGAPQFFPDLNSSPPVPPPRGCFI
jgi:hypothetical protein